MAGIAGWIAPGRRPGDEAALGPMAAALAHRTHAGETLSGVVDVNERRQAVLGASLRDEPSGISVVLDGNLANERELRADLGWRGFPFRTATAAEVLLRAYQYWDKDVVKHLRGGFAFAIWDAGKDRLLIARDRFGEKPLYLHERNGALYFASEIKALLKAGVRAETDEQALRECMAQGYVPGPRTLFAGIRKLAPATYGLWQFGKLREVRYWVAPDRNPYVKNGAIDHVLPQFVHTLREAAKLHAGSAIFLSGGLDSAVLVALMSGEGAKPKTFSLGFEGDQKSELPFAARLAQHFGTTHQEIVIAPRELIASLPRLVAYRDAPVPRPSELAVHRLACEAARTASTVVTGDGCDEIMGGYRRYLFAPLGRGGPLPESDADPQNSKLRRALYADQVTSLPEQLLERNDRAIGAASLEAGMPFLDHRVAEYVSALPDAQRVHGLETKRILRRAARELLPRALWPRPKAGWRLDVAGWLRNDLREMTLDHLQGASSVIRRHYDAAALDRVLEDHLQGKKNRETLIWTLLNIEIWHRTYTPA